jgi:hypothetical protein
MIRMQNLRFPGKCPSRKIPASMDKKKGELLILGKLAVL